MNRCVLRIVHATMTDATLNVANTVSTETCRKNTFRSPAFCLLSNIAFVAKVQYIGAAQLLMKVRMPTAPAL